MRNQLIKCSYYFIIAALVMLSSCTQRIDKNDVVAFSDSLYLKNIPSQPDEDTWKFIDDLKSPMWTNHGWKKTDPGPHRVDLTCGVQLQTGFPDSKGRLETCYEDLYQFFAAEDVSCNNCAGIR